MRSKAKKLGLTGWVRNLKDGRVEAVVQGETEVIEKLISHCNKGPFFSKPTNIVVDWEEQEEQYNEFEKRETL